MMATMIVGELRHTAAAVAAHLAPGAVGVIEMELKIGNFGVVHCHEAVAVCEFT